MEVTLVGCSSWRAVPGLTSALVENIEIAILTVVLRESGKVELRNVMMFARLSCQR
jgi:hypothetical protein